MAYKPAVPVLWRMRQGHCSKFKASLGYRMRLAQNKGIRDPQGLPSSRALVASDTSSSAFWNPAHGSGKALALEPPIQALFAVSYPDSLASAVAG